jgi:hypothetical protein
MKIRTFVPVCRLAGLGVALAASLGLAQAAGAPAVTRVFIVVVPPAQDQAFTQGMKDWHKCLHDHGSKQPGLAYSALTGDLDRYLFLDEHGTWADMDAHDPAEKTCGPTFVSEVLPHAGQAFSEIAELNSKDTYMPAADPDPPPMMWVDLYRLKPGQKESFEGVLAKYAAAAAKTHWEGHFASYDIEGAPQGAENFVVVWPNKSWADIGRDPKPSPKELAQSVYGKAAARVLHDKYIAAIAAQWSDTWTYQKDLSYIPAK